MRILNGVLTFLVIIFLGSVSLAEEMPSPKKMTLKNGVICDTLDQVKYQLDLIIAHPNSPSPAAEGCGRLKVAPQAIAMFGGAPATVTPLEFYESGQLVILVACYDFVNQKLGTQFGWIGWYVQKPEMES